MQYFHVEQLFYCQYRTNVLRTFDGTEKSKYTVPFLQNSVPKYKLFLKEVLWELDENRFQKITCVTWKTFETILNLIKDDDLFNHARSCKYFPVETQLAIVLYRLGSSGEGPTLSKIAGLFEISDGDVIQVRVCHFSA